MSLLVGQGREIHRELGVDVRIHDLGLVAVLREVPLDETHEHRVRVFDDSAAFLVDALALLVDGLDHALLRAMPHRHDEGVSEDAHRIVERIAIGAVVLDVEFVRAGMDTDSKTGFRDHAVLGDLLEERSLAIVGERLILEEARELHFRSVLTGEGTLGRLVSAALARAHFRERLINVAGLLHDSQHKEEVWRAQERALHEGDEV